jgi:uncharacterized protein (DUF58 family)
LIAAAVARIAIAGGDPVGLLWMGGPTLPEMGVGFGRAAFDRLVSRLEDAQAEGRLADEPDEMKRVVRQLGRRSGQGSVLLVLSDLLDLPEPSRDALVSLASGRRALVVVQVLDPVERELSFRGKVRLRAIESDTVVVTDADAVRAEYQARLAEHTALWRRALEGHGGRLVEATTSDDAVTIVRRALQAVSEVRRA